MTKNPYKTIYHPSLTHFHYELMKREQLFLVAKLLILSLNQEWLVCERVAWFRAWYWNEWWLMICECQLVSLYFKEDRYH